METANYTSTAIPTDEETVERILKGEKHLYASLIRKFNLQLYRISMSIIKDETEVEDIMQTAYLNAYRQLASFQNKASFSTWLTRILINESLLHKKRKIRGKQFFLNHVLKYENTDTPIAKLMNQELKEILERTVSKLPEKYRLVFVMREVQEMSVHETMQILGLGEANVKVRLSRAKEMLRAEINNYYNPNQLFEFNLIRCDRIVDYVMNKIETDALSQSASVTETTMGLNKTPLSHEWRGRWSKYLHSFIFLIPRFLAGAFSKSRFMHKG